MWKECKGRGEAGRWEEEAGRLRGVWEVGKAGNGGRGKAGGKAAGGKGKTTTKGVGRRKGEEVQRAKREPSGYIKFCKAMREGVVRELEGSGGNGGGDGGGDGSGVSVAPKKPPFGLVTKTLANRWNNLTQREKQDWKDKVQA